MYNNEMIWNQPEKSLQTALVNSEKDKSPYCFDFPLTDLNMKIQKLPII